MPIPTDDLKTNAGSRPVFAVLAPDATVADALAQLPENRNQRIWMYTVVPLADGRYLVARWIEVELTATAVGRDVRGERLTSLDELLSTVDPNLEISLGAKKLKAGELPARFTPAQAVEQDSMGLAEARAVRDKHPADRLVVLKDGAVLGLFLNETLSATTLPPDPFAPSTSPPAPGSGGAFLGNDDNQAGGVAPDGAVDLGGGAAPKADERVVNFWAEQPVEQGSRRQPQTTPLKEQTIYEFKINVGKPVAGAISSVDAGQGLTVIEEEIAEQLYDLTLIIESNDVTIYGRTDAVLVVERGKASKNTATFTIETRDAGPAKMTVFFVSGGRVFQRIDFTLNVGGAPGRNYLEGQVERGLSTASARGLAERDQDQAANLMIIKRENGYQFVLQAGGVTRAFIPLTTAAIVQLITRARQQLRQVVGSQDSTGTFFYAGTNTTVPEAAHQASLKTLVQLGAQMYRAIFFAPNAGQDAKTMGTLLSKISQRQQLQIQVVAEQFIFPWTLLYDQKFDKDNPPNEDGFWGFRHSIEYLPEFGNPTITSFDPVIRASEALPMAAIFNTTIDPEMEGKGFGANAVIAPQREFFKTGLPNVQVAQYETTQDFYDLLQNPETPPLIYIYCHAVSRMVGEKLGTSESHIALSDGNVTLDDIDFNAPVEGEPPMKNAPLVFLNACQSAELDPQLYDGLVPRLLARGARGVIGTEVDTPAFFAAEFARQFYTEFTKGGRPLGELMLDLRRHYLKEKRNLMGLVYALYSSGDVVVERG